MSAKMRNKNLSFSGYLWLTIALFVFLTATFAVYVLSEKTIDRANDLRQHSFLLADELRQSSDDLTRMVRTYVVTGDPRFKEYYQDILDIRNGKQPRPDKDQHVFWDLVAAKELPSRSGNGTSIALLTLMRQAGITEQEFRKLEEAKANSDGLTAIEFEAMKLSEMTGPDAEASRARARAMLHDDKYHQAKAAIMKPINDFFILMDRRTVGVVQDSKLRALIFRGIFLAFGLSLVVMLLRTKKFLDSILGASVDEIRKHISQIGRGDFSSGIPAAEVKQGSVLHQLVEMKTRLREIDLKRQQATADAEAQRTLLSGLAAQVPGVVYQFYARANGETGCYYISNQAEPIFGFKPDLEKGLENFTASVLPEFKESYSKSMDKAIREASEWKYEGMMQKSSGEKIWFAGRSMPTRCGDELVFNGILMDITEIKNKERDLELVRKQMEFILGATGTGLDIIDSGFNMVYIDPEWAKVYGDYKNKKCYEYFMDKKEICPGCGIVKALETKKVVVKRRFWRGKEAGGSRSRPYPIRTRTVHGWSPK